ncbi:MAG: hypothetical protein K2M17_05460 [Bacilli bacterium]|nr:hypothetical protein [Bacilli bacterium]
MKKKNGFISTSVVYTFFFVFLMLLLFMINGYVNNRTLLRSVKTDIKNELSNGNFSRYLISSAQADSFLIYHNAATTSYDAGDYSYRFSGRSVNNNYVCFDSSASSCPSDNLYRIVGVIDGKVKLIKNTSVANQQWNTFANADFFVDWVNSSLYKYLNESFYSTISSASQNLIEPVIWHAAGLETNSLLARDAYAGEMTNNDKNVTAPIGLLYINDYAYAAAQNSWISSSNKVNGSRFGSSYNWLSSGSNFWLISPQVKDSGMPMAFYVTSSGIVSTKQIDSTVSIGVRPTFFLKPTVKIISGEGTVSNPYRVGG